MDSLCHHCNKAPPAVRCSCKEPPVIVCEDCLSLHIISQKTLRHSTEQIVHQQPTTEKLLKCDVCEAHQAQLLCLCRGVKTRLCHGCIVFHITKHSKSAHPLEQIQADELIEDFGGFSREYIERTQTIEYLVNEARANLTVLRLFRKEVVEAHERLREQIIEHSQNILSEVSEMEKYVQGVVDRIESTRYAKCLDETDWAQQLVLRANPRNLTLLSQELCMVKTVITLEPALDGIRGLAQLSLVRDPAKRELDIPFFKSKTNEMLLYEKSTGNVTAQQIARLAMKDVAGWTMITAGQVFYCGGCENNEYSRQVYLVNTVSLEATELADMHHGRAFPSVIYHKNAVYVFGGYAGMSMKYSEKYDLVRNAWSKLPDMPSSRSAFTIAELNNKLYLAGDSRTIDVYDVENNSYTVCEVTLPQTGTYLTLVAVENCLLFLQNDQAWKVDLEENSSEVLCSLPSGKWWSHFPVIAQEGLVYLCRYDDFSLWLFDYKLREIRRLVKY